jgi:hypothetical protein
MTQLLPTISTYLSLKVYIDEQIHKIEKNMIPLKYSISSQIITVECNLCKQKISVETEDKCACEIRLYLLRQHSYQLTLCLAHIINTKIDYPQFKNDLINLYIKLEKKGNDLLVSKNEAYLKYNFYINQPEDSAYNRVTAVMTFDTYKDMSKNYIDNIAKFNDIFDSILSIK